MRSPHWMMLGFGASALICGMPTRAAASALDAAFAPIIAKLADGSPGVAQLWQRLSSEQVDANWASVAEATLAPLAQTARDAGGAASIHCASSVCEARVALPAALNLTQATIGIQESMDRLAVNTGMKYQALVTMAQSGPYQMLFLVYYTKPALAREKVQNTLPSVPAATKGQVEVGFQVDVTPLGLPENCRVVNSSGNAVLDATVCQNILKQGHFKPTNGPDGKPIRSIYRSTVKFMLPAG